jgi:hypothetical protein
MLIYGITPSGATPLGPSSGFLATYSGPQNGDLDIASGDAILRGGNFEFDATLNAPIGTTNGVFYVWGIDRGTGLAPFGAFRPGVLFDSVVISAPSLNTNFVLDLLTSQMTALVGSQVDVSGDTLKLFVPHFAASVGGFFSRRLSRQSLDARRIGYSRSDADCRVRAEQQRCRRYGARTCDALAVRCWPVRRDRHAPAQEEIASKT